MKPCIIRTADLTDAQCLWLHKNFLVPNGVRHYVPRESDLVIAGNFLSVVTVDFERPSQDHQPYKGRRWRIWRSSWNIHKHGLPLKMRQYRIRRPLTPTELGRFRQPEGIQVIDLGEEFEVWFVTGTSDAHSAEEAVREYWSSILEGDDVREMSEDYPSGGLGLEYRTDWAWKHPEGWPPEREPEDDSRLVCGDEGASLPRFAGYLATL